VVTPTVAVATSHDFPELEEDWPLLRQALGRLGVAARAEVWTDDRVDWSAFDAVVIRGTWDYIDRLEPFRSWVRAVEAQTRLVNPAPVVSWNADKRYLADLAAAGVPIVATRWVAPGERWEPPAEEFVVKPTVSVGGLHTARYRLDDVEAADRHIRRLHQAGRAVMVQPFMASVERQGEPCLVYLGGTFSHAVRKSSLLELGAAARDHLGERQRITPIDASREQRRVAEAALAAVPATARSLFGATGASTAVPVPAAAGGSAASAGLAGPITYARVDLFSAAGGEAVVSEVELIEPWLFLAYAPGAADRFARVLAALVGAG
jgi:hypothetical protein